MKQLYLSTIVFSLCRIFLFDTMEPPRDGGWDKKSVLAN